MGSGRSRRGMFQRRPEGEFRQGSAEGACRDSEIPIETAFRTFQVRMDPVRGDLASEVPREMRASLVSGLRLGRC
jgi:hypothetical protein